MKEAERAWRGINVVDQQMYLKDAYLKDQLKWPPRVSSSFCFLAGIQSMYVLLKYDALCEKGANHCCC